MDHFNHHCINSNETKIGDSNWGILVYFRFHKKKTKSKKCRIEFFFRKFQIVAVILSTTGIALLAYMDGIAQTRTLAGVVISAASSAGSAIYKVFFKKVFGEVTFCQVAIFFSMIGLCSLVLLWPIFLALYFSGAGKKTAKNIWTLS